jgi:hypothetical protein
MEEHSEHTSNSIDQIQDEENNSCLCCQHTISLWSTPAASENIAIRQISLHNETMNITKTTTRIRTRTNE